MRPASAGGGQGRLPAQAAAEAAVRSVGCGYDLTGDLRLVRAKPGGRLVEVGVQGARARELLLPGGAVVLDVPPGIVADKGERSRFRSDVLSFSQMAEQVNQSLSVSGKIPSGAFNAMFDYRGCWHRDATATRSLCFDSRFVELYTVEAARARLALHDRVSRDVPLSWDPPALAAFIDKYGTHVIVGVKMGGKDVVCIKQLRGCNLTQSDVQGRLKKLADDKFSQDHAETFTARDDRFSQGLNGNFGPGSAAWHSFRSPVVSHKDDIVSIHIRRGGVDSGQCHSRWLPTINSFPDVISMAFVPITSLLNGVRGCGFLNHAVNLYLRYKPPIEELHQFLEFQVPRQWAPEFGELPLALGPQRKNSLPSLQFILMGRKLHVNTTKVDSGSRPVTGIRLFLEGKKSDRLGVHLQHLSAAPATFTVAGEAAASSGDDAAVNERDYFEPVRSPLLSHVCTAPVQYNGARIDDCAAIVTRAWLDVREACLKKVLFLRLGFSGVAATKIRRSEWDGPFVVPRRSGSLSGLFSARLSGGAAPMPPPPEGKVEVNSAIFPKGPPVPLVAQKMAKYVDTTEVRRGPEDLPGYWVVTGAKLCVESGKVALKVKYSLLIAVQEDTDV